MQILTATNPERYAITIGKSIYLLQVENDGCYNIIKSTTSKEIKSKRRAGAKCVLLKSGEALAEGETYQSILIDTINTSLAQ